MTFEQFRLLDDVGQAIVVLDMGVFLAKRREGAYRHVLYQIEHFYVEVHYHEELDAIKGLTPIEDTESLGPYLDTIDLTSLFQS